MLNHLKKHAVQSFVAFESPVGHPAWPTILRVAQATNAPIATEALGQIPKLYAIEADVRGHSVRNSPQSLQAVVEAMRLVFEEQPPVGAGRSTIAEAIRYALSRWTPCALPA
jgi:hypothetical protein